MHPNDEKPSFFHEAGHNYLGLLLYCELNPSTGHFHQVLMTRNCYEEILEVLAKHNNQGDSDLLDMPLHPNQCIQLDRFKGYYEPTEIEKLATIDVNH